MDTSKDRAGLLWLAGLCSLGLVVIALVAVYHGITADAATIVGVIAGGLVAFAKDIVAAIRGYSMSAQLGKVTDQLAASAPSTGDTVQDVRVTNAADDAVPVEAQQ